jgi:hypothetical protein
VQWVLTNPLSVPAIYSGYRLAPDSPGVERCRPWIFVGKAIEQITPNDLERTPLQLAARKPEHVRQGTAVREYL